MFPKKIFQSLLVAIPGNSLKCRQFSSHAFTTVKQTKPTEEFERPEFPGLRSQFSTELNFIDASSYETIPTFRVLKQDGHFEDKAFVDKIDLNLILKIYNDMIKLNQMDMILYEAQRQGRISFYMTSYGEEATHFGPAAALKDEDLVFGQYREPGVLMWRGFTLEQFVNQCFGNQLDLGKGRQMPIHYGSRELNYMTIKSTLTSQMLHAVGAAYAFKLRQNNLVSLCYFGDGAASEGDAHAAFNFAATLNCPIILFCRNNGYAISTPTTEQYQGDGIAARGPAMGIPTIRVDGNDVLACYFAVKEARKICTQEMKPVLIEAMTYRISHHSTSDDSSVYRNLNEVQTWKEKEHPLNRIKLLLKNSNLLDEEKDKKYKDEIRKELIDILSKTEQTLKPPVRDLFTDVLDEMTPILEEQYENLKKHLHQYGDKYPRNFKDIETLKKPHSNGSH